MSLVGVPHRCTYGHTWEVLLLDGYSYDHPSRRFCPECLEWNRIEVGSMQMETWVDSARIEYICPQCFQRTHIALIPDHVGEMFWKDTALEEMFEKKIRWYHLPQHWPTMCEHDLRR